MSIGSGIASFGVFVIVPLALIFGPRVLAVMERRTHALDNAGYWRGAYETLVRKTGRDLNDGLGLDPRSHAARKDRP